MTMICTIGPPAAASAPNILTQAWAGPHGGIPPFDKVKVADFKPALQLGMVEKLAEVEKIAGNPAPPSFENTLIALELSGQTYRRVKVIYDFWSSNMNAGDFPALETQMEPKIAAFGDKIVQNEKLFARIQAVYRSREKSALTSGQQRLVWVYYNDFVRAGAGLAPDAKSRVAAINERLASLYTRFSQNLLADETAQVLFLKTEAELAGLPESIRAAAAQAAIGRGHTGEWAILNTRSAVEPFLTYSERRDLREQVWRTFSNRGDNGDAHDNNAIISAILQLRGERARLLGFDTHAHWRVAEGMAKTPEIAMSLMMQVWPAAIVRVREEVADMQLLADKERAGIKIAGWDYRYYAEKVRKARYDLDMNLVKPYLQLDKLRDGMFWVAGRLYGFQFIETDGLPRAHPDIRVWEVRNASGGHVGLWYFDPYARPGKKSGAWMSDYRLQSKLGRNTTPIVSNNSNFSKGRPGEPVLISWDDAVTMFHEFGHALHGLNSNVLFSSLAGTNVVRDFVEFPSQLNENWLTTPELLARFAVHYQTGAPMPDELLQKVKNAGKFNQGFKTVEYLSSALVDMKLHLSNDPKINPAAFERSTLAELNMPAEMVMRHRTAQFGHLFSSDDYSAGYYSYLWAEVLDHDAFDAFIEAGGPYDGAVAKRLYDEIMSIGNSVDAAQAYRNFRGRDPKIDALLRARGFASSATTAGDQ